MVVLFHCFYYAPGPNYVAVGLVHHLYLYFERFVAIGWTGVDLFFVLSGFLIGGILLEVRDSKHFYTTFYARRFFRIIPPYYAWIAVYVLVVAVMQLLKAREIVTPAEGTFGEFKMLLTQIFFLQNFGVLNSYAVLAGVWFWPTWSLAVEEQFYLIMPIMIRRTSRNALIFLLSGVVLLAPLLRLWIYYRFPAQRVGLGMIYTLMPCRADGLGLGVLAAVLWREIRFREWLSKRVTLLYVLVGLFFAGFALLAALAPADDRFLMQSIGYTWIGFFFVLLLLLVLTDRSGPLARFARQSWLRAFGCVSYCLYLIHYGLRVSLHGLLAVTVKHVESWQGISVDLLTIAVSFAIARVSWVYFEHPLVKRGHAFKY